MTPAQRPIRCCPRGRSTMARSSQRMRAEDPPDVLEHQWHGFRGSPALRDRSESTETVYRSRTTSSRVGASRLALQLARGRMAQPWRPRRSPTRRGPRHPKRPRAARPAEAEPRGLGPDDLSRPRRDEPMHESMFEVAIAIVLAVLVARIVLTAIDDKQRHRDATPSRATGRAPRPGWWR
jgi:hypothetical protein